MYVFYGFEIMSLKISGAHLRNTDLYSFYKKFIARTNGIVIILYRESEDSLYRAFSHQRPGSNINNYKKQVPLRISRRHIKSLVQVDQSKSELRMQ